MFLMAESNSIVTNEISSVTKIEISFCVRWIHFYCLVKHFLCLRKSLEKSIKTGCWGNTKHKLTGQDMNLQKFTNQHWVTSIAVWMVKSPAYQGCCR